MYSESFHFSPLPSRPPSPNPTISSLDHHNHLPPDMPASILAPFSSWSDLAKMKFRLCHTIIQNLPCLPAFPTSFWGKAQALGCPQGLQGLALDPSRVPHSTLSLPGPVPATLAFSLSPEQARPTPNSGTQTSVWLILSPPTGLSFTAISQRGLLDCHIQVSQHFSSPPCSLFFSLALSTHTHTRFHLIICFSLAVSPSQELKFHGAGILFCQFRSLLGP